jgi:phosphatidylserine/phosphatidylglycerophosphate/cardiolipin synthase-like enzyme
MARRRTTRRSRSTRPSPPRLSTILVLVAILAGLYAYQQGYLDRWLTRLTEAVGPIAPAPELEDGDTAAAAPNPPEAIQPQPSEPPPPVVPPLQQVETNALRGFSGGWYQVYFTRPAYPEGPANRSGGLDETIAADLNNAQRQIDLATFDYDLPVITQALIAAHGRGVQVRVIVDGENLEDPEVARLTGDLQNAGIAVFFDQRSAFMHNKFIVIDGQTVWSGSMNFTINDVFRNNNNMLRIVDPSLAANYRAKADDLFSGNGGPGPSVLVNPMVTIGGAPVATWFAPDDPVTQAVIDRINGAQQRIEVLAFAYTSDPIAEAMIAARGRGLAVRGVMESRNVRGSGSEFEKLRTAGIDMHSDGNCYIMHHKAIVIDGRTVITGSFNWTAAAQDQNDENVLIIDDPGLAARFGEEFERIYQQALQPTACG